MPALEGKFGPYEEDWIKSHQALVNASVNGKRSVSSCGHCVHCFKYECMAREIQEFVASV